MNRMRVLALAAVVAGSAIFPAAATAPVTMPAHHRAAKSRGRTRSASSPATTNSSSSSIGSSGSARGGSRWRPSVSRAGP